MVFLSTNLVDRFSQNLTAIEYPKKSVSWNIAGILKGHNAFYKFDVRDMFKLSSGEWAQKSNIKNSADKMVLEGEKEWLILDLEELHEYIRKENKTKVYINDLISDLEWTIFLAKK
tara:strand:+ start:5714 stop:6061 length:348 start_codon:yes stop_codon:yes gene_type:complete